MVWYKAEKVNKSCTSTTGCNSTLSVSFVPFGAIMSDGIITSTYIVSHEYSKLSKFKYRLIGLHAEQESDSNVMVRTALNRVWFI